MQNNEIIVTVFTPTYNRAYTLERTYESLLSQDCKDFVWLIVDDGSTDETASLVKSWQDKCNDFEIRYIYKENGGMHTAHNTAYENIDTELNVCIDSDDMLAPNAISKILTKWNEIKDMDYAGIIGLDAYYDGGGIVGSGFPKGMEETTFTDYYGGGGKGDKKLVYRTDVIKRYPPYPVFEGEKFFSPSYIYRLIDEDYKLAVLDDVLCIVEYQNDGSTHNMFKQYIQNPKGFVAWRIFCMEHPLSRRRLIVDNIHYVSSCIIAGNKHFIKQSPTKALTLLACPAGLLLSKYIKYKTVIL